MGPPSHTFLSQKIKKCYSGCTGPCSGMRRHADLLGLVSLGRLTGPLIIVEGLVEGHPVVAASDPHSLQVGIQRREMNAGINGGRLD